MTTERLEVQRTIAAEPAAIFRVLCDPQGHVTIDSSGMLMDATGEPVTAVGDSFVVHMDREALNDYPMGRYDVTVTIATFVPDREIGSARAFDIMLTGRDVDAGEAERIGLVSRVVTGDDLLEECYSVAERMIGFSRVGVEVTKRMLWSSLDAASLHAHMDHEGIAQLYVRLTTQNFEEAIRARKEKRTPEYRD